MTTDVCHECHGSGFVDCPACDDGVPCTDCAIAVADAIADQLLPLPFGKQTCTECLGYGTNWNEETIS